MPESKLETAANNLENIRRIGASLSEKEFAHIAELAEILCDEAGEEEIFFRDETFINRYRLLTEARPFEEVADFNAEKVRISEKLHKYAEKAFLCMRVCDIFGIGGIKDVGTFFEGLYIESESNISCLRSPMTDEAYMKFSEILPNARVVYADDFGEVCENVYYGKTSYCILPVSSTADGRLTGFRALASKYGLKTAYTCTVGNSDGDKTVFALMKKNLILPADRGGLCFEFSVKAEKSVTELLCVAEVCGMEIVSVLSDRKGVDVIVRVNDDGFCGFLSYLYLSYPDFIPVGLFNEIR